MKKIFSLALCLTSLPALAQPALYFDGFMIAGAVGATAAQYNLKQNIVIEQSSSVVYSQPDSVNLYANTPTGEISGGYSYQFDNHYVLGGYFTAGYSDAKSTDHVNYSSTLQGNRTIEIDSEIITELRNDFAVLLKPGYVWERSTLLYGLLGARWGNFKSTVKTNIEFESPRIASTANDSDTVSKYIAGFTMGLGVQQMLTTRYSWALEYAYTIYGSLSTADNVGELEINGVLDPASTYSNNPGVKAYTNTLLFMIAYRI
jgi:opacity protein-like surface antigen